LVIEVDGSIHNREDIQKSDRERQITLESEGIKVIRLTNDEILKNIDVTIEKIKSVINERNI